MTFSQFIILLLYAPKTLLDKKTLLSEVESTEQRFLQSIRSLELTIQSIESHIQMFRQSLRSLESTFVSYMSTKSQLSEREHSQTRMELKKFMSSFETDFYKLHYFNKEKVNALKKVSAPAVVCGFMVTAHFLLYNNLVFGVTVAHTPCPYDNDFEAALVNLIPCKGIDVALWNGSIPDGVESILDITTSVETAEIGDATLSYGFYGQGNQPRSWLGTIAGKLGVNSSARHFTSGVYKHEDEFLLDGMAKHEMSGGGVLNNQGGYLGVVRTALNDSIDNHQPVMTPWSLIKQCVERKSNLLMRIEDVFKKKPNMNVITIPSF